MYLRDNYPQSQLEACERLLGPKAEEKGNKNPVKNFGFMKTALIGDAIECVRVFYLSYLSYMLVEQRLQAPAETLNYWMRNFKHLMSEALDKADCTKEKFWDIKTNQMLEVVLLFNYYYPVFIADERNQ